MVKTRDMGETCCSYGCGELTKKKVLVEYLYLDLKTCNRCIGTDIVLDEVMVKLTPALELAGCSVEYHKVEMATAEIARQYKFLSSPTIRVNGQDICQTVTAVSYTHLDVYKRQKPSSSAGHASGSNTLAIIWSGEAPIDSAASITPGSISLREFSTTRATNGTAATASGKMAPRVPIDTPTSNFVIGINKKSKITNGIERPVLTMLLKMAFSCCRGRICPGAVTTNNTPNGTPTAKAMARDSPTMYSCLLYTSRCV